MNYKAHPGLYELIQSLLDQGIYAQSEIDRLSNESYLDSDEVNSMGSLSPEAWEHSGPDEGRALQILFDKLTAGDISRQTKRASVAQRPLDYIGLPF